MTYDVSAHPLLSDEAKQLGSDLPEEADAAEAILDAALTDRGYEALTEAGHKSDSIEHSRATLAVVHQVNYQIEAGVDAEVYKRERRGERTSEFTGEVVSPRAMTLALTLVSAASSTDWPVAGALR